MLKKLLLFTFTFLVISLFGATASAQNGDDGWTFQSSNTIQTTCAPVFNYVAGLNGGLRRNPDGSGDLAGCTMMTVAGASSGSSPSSYQFQYSILDASGNVISQQTLTEPMANGSGSFSIHLAPGVLPASPSAFGLALVASAPGSGCNGNWRVAVDTRLPNGSGPPNFGGSQNNIFRSPGTFPSSTTCSMPPPTCDTSISSYTSSATTINVGQSATLSWNVFHGITADINGTSIALPSGSMAVSPTSTTTYTLTVNGPNGCPPVTQSITITVNSCPDAASSSFTASPTSIIQGQSTTLSFNFPNAASVTIDNGVGTFGASGSVAVTPASTTTYTATANASGCTPVSLQVTVTVTPCQTIASYTASSTSIVQGQSTTLSYSLSGATSATITDLTSGQVTSVPVQSGSLTVTPASTRTYRLSASGPCATVTQDITINVTPCQTISSFSASSTSIIQGQSTTLSYSLSGATSATITDLTSGAVTSVPVQSGSLVVTPASTRTYRLSAVGPCATVTQDITITVTPCQTITSFTASPSAITQGGSTTLSYSATGGTSATITDLTSGAVTTVTLPSGTLTVTPATTRTYRFTVNGPCAAVTQDVTVTVTSCQVISSFSASSTSIVQGQSVTLSYALSGATTATITDLASGTVTSVPVQSGSLVVTPASTRTYRLTANGPCTAVTQDITITVTPCQTITSFTATPSTINVGQSTTLSYSLSGATSATITDLTSGTVTNVPVQSGSLVVTPATTRTYRLTVNGPCAQLTQDLTITVNQPPTINSFSAAPASLCAGASTTLTWTSTGGASATITDLTSGTVTNVPVNGSLTVTPPSSRTYRLTVTNGAGSVTRDVAVTVTPLAVINTFSASATTINAGQSVTFTFNVSNTTARSITDLATSVVTNLATESGTATFSPATSRTYRLTAQNGCNTVTQDIAITVTQLPVINSLSASPASICAGSSSTISWSATGGTSATISAPGLPGSPVAVNPNSGSLTVTPSSTTTYTLTVTNGAGSVTSTTTVTVTPLPAIGTFTASPSTVTQGSSSTLAWTSTNGTSATITDLTSGTVTNVGVNSSLSVTPASTRTYRLSLTNSCSTVTQDVTVTVTPCQAITAFTASPSTIGTGASTTLSWTTTGGTSGTITDLTSGTVTNISLPNGSLVVTPASTRTYRLTLNGPCAAVTQDVTVTVSPCNTINSFTVNGFSVDTTAAQGSNVVVAWNISNFTSASITVYVDGNNSGSFPITTPTGSMNFTQPASSFIFVLVVNGACAQQSATRYVYTAPCPTVAGSTFTATPSTISSGQSSTLAWNVPNAASVTISGVAGTFGASGSVTVTPSSTTTYTLTATGVSGCSPITMQATVTIAGVLIGPKGHPDAVGPTSNNDDYTNMTLVNGVNVAPGGVTTAGGVIIFTNTVLNNSSSSQGLTVRATSIPAGFTAEASLDGGATWQNLSGAGVSGTLSANQSFDVLVRVTVPAGQSVLTAFPVVLRTMLTSTPTIYNETIDRVWTGFVRVIKTNTVSNATNVGGQTDAVSGAVIQYAATYTNITTSSGTGNVDLTATNVVLTEDGFAAPNNWGTTTTHVPGSASDTRGGAITGDVAGSNLLTDTVPSLAPGQSGTFAFSRKIK